jgi:hypothetical protein
MSVIDPLKQYLKQYFTHLQLEHLIEDDDFTNYERFRKFIHEHYNLEHLMNFNYIKYVKVKRQIMIMSDGAKYFHYISIINSIIKQMADMNIFSKVNIKNYMYRINTFFRLIKKKKELILHTITSIRSILDLKITNTESRFKILIYINTLSNKYNFFCRYSNKLIYYIHELLELEESHGIDHKLIELHNMQRMLIGKKSEYVVNKRILEYINLSNKDESDHKIYYYETNVNLLKMLNIRTELNSIIKGEIDGFIISFDGVNYIIEKIIEVKSSVKSIFDDSPKFIHLQNYIQNMYMNSEKIHYKHYVFDKNSFQKIMNEHMSYWAIYICINNKQDIIEKSYLYFSSVLKIVDDRFIQSFYIDKSDQCIIDKYKIILNSKESVNKIFVEWKKNIGIDEGNCNVFFSKKINSFNE